MQILDESYHQANPTGWVRQYLGFHPDGKQRQVLEAKTNRGILCCSRQWGKSTTTAAMAVHHAWLNPESLVLVASRTEDQSNELVRKVRRFLHRLGAKSRGELTLPNGSRIVPLPGDDDNVRGYSAATLILIDEAARVPDELYHALLPMLATTNGALWMMSTPNGKRGFFWEAWTADDDTTRIQATAEECARISPAFLAQERRRMPRAAFESEYMCVFNQQHHALLAEEELDAVFR
jgi:hypothetical protein